MHLERNLEVQWGFERQRNGGKGLQAEYLACSKAGTWGAGPTAALWWVVSVWLLLRFSMRRGGPHCWAGSWLLLQTS